ncbi:MAG: FecR domain-containing protein [Patescibacteria group bacterium]|nr:FecR domain-containing protein [Patescibacteria group bacterium]MDE2437847.1 FecR domain-containing protein [Patescibacteria group bacterium]
MSFSVHKGRIGAVLALLLVGGGVLIYFAYTSSRLPGSSVPSSPSSVQQPWIEVVTPPVFDVATHKELQTGDELAEGSTVEAGPAGLANIYFANGSLMRVDSNTRFTLQNVSYDTKTRTSVTRIQLIIGRVWSKLIALATPESVWEVKTVNAVATVRGTAFGVEYTPDNGGTTRIIGAEHQISVGLVDPATQNVVADNAATVTSGTYVQITTPDVGRVIAHQVPVSEVVVVKKTPDTILQQPWIQQSLQADTTVDNQLQSLHNDVNAYQGLVEQRKIELQNTNGTRPTTSISVPLASTTLTIETNMNTDDSLAVGATTFFHAYVHLENGATQDVTPHASWQVHGPIGTITSDGIFTAALDSQREAYGSGTGFISASWEDAAHRVYSASSPTLVVEIPEPAPPANTVEGQ